VKANWVLVGITGIYAVLSRHQGLPGDKNGHRPDNFRRR
jgi:hypothetical protein